MTKQTVLSLIMGCFMILAMSSVFAAETQTKAQLQSQINTQAQATLPRMSTIIQKLQAKGYNIIRKIKFENGAYEVEAINAQGNEFNLRVNPQTGDIFGPTENPIRINMLDAVKKVEAAGYRNIYKIKSDDDKYEVKALDKNGKQVELEVNAITGVISKDWF